MQQEAIKLLKVEMLVSRVTVVKSLSGVAASVFHDAVKYLPRAKGLIVIKHQKFAASTPAINQSLGCREKSYVYEQNCRGKSLSKKQRAKEGGWEKWDLRPTTKCDLKSRWPLFSTSSNQRCEDVFSEIRRICIDGQNA